MHKAIRKLSSAKPKKGSQDTATEDSSSSDDDDVDNGPASRASKDHTPTMEQLPTPLPPSIADSKKPSTTSSGTVQSASSVDQCACLLSSKPLSVRPRERMTSTSSLRAPRRLHFGSERQRRAFLWSTQTQLSSADGMLLLVRVRVVGSSLRYHPNYV